MRKDARHYGILTERRIKKKGGFYLLFKQRAESGTRTRDLPITYCSPDWPKI